MCVSRKRRLFENEDFIIESNFDEDEDFFVHISMYTLVELMINIFPTLLSISSIN